MSEKFPLVSIVAANYNFGKYIPYFVESILKQTYTNWELIVTDDCSTDDSMEVLRRYERMDSRIRVFKNQKNRHASYTVNNSLRNATGEYVCLMSCDDALLPDKVAHDVAYLEQHPDIGVLYGQLQQIDEYNVPRPYSYFPPSSFNRFGLLREMFLEGNKCPSPGMFIRKGVVAAVGYLHPLLRMTHDYEYHIRILFKENPAFNSHPLTQYRRMSDNTNLSSTDDERTINSECNETFLILENYTSHIRRYDALIEIFPEVTEFGPVDDRLVPYFLGRMALKSSHAHVNAFGIETIFRFMSKQGNSEYLEEKTGFTPKDFMNLVADCQIFCSSKYPSQYSLAKKLRKKAFRWGRFLRRYLNNCESFRKQK